MFISSNTTFADQIAAYVKASSFAVALNSHETKNDFNSSYVGLLKNISQDIYSRTFAIFDEIGCVKNFVKVLGKRLYTLRCPITNKSYL